MLSQLKKVDTYLDIDDDFDFSQVDENVFEKMQLLHGIDAIGQARINQIETLTLQLRQSKMFLNMVIHDMRNPTVSIKLGLQACISALSFIGLIFKDQIKFSGEI